MSKSVFDFTPDEARAYLKKKGKVRLAVLHMSHEGQMIRTGGVGAVVAVLCSAVRHGWMKVDTKSCSRNRASTRLFCRCRPTCSAPNVPGTRGSGLSWPE